MAAGHFLHLKDLQGVTGETVCNVCVLWLDKLTPESLKGGTLKYLSNKMKCSFIIIYLLLNVVPKKYDSRKCDKSWKQRFHLETDIYCEMYLSRYM